MLSLWRHWRRYLALWSHLPLERLAAGAAEAVEGDAVEAAGRIWVAKWWRRGFRFFLAPFFLAPFFLAPFANSEVGF